MGALLGAISLHRHEKNQTRGPNLARKTTTKSRAMPDFEKALAELEALVERMEQGDATLEESLQYFERGIALTRTCQEALKGAEQKVQMLIEKDGRAELKPFAADED
jgi:exodeoxyribonuclease VII small subunit